MWLWLVSEFFIYCLSTFSDNVSCISRSSSTFLHSSNLFFVGRSCSSMRCQRSHEFCYFCFFQNSLDVQFFSFLWTFIFSIKVIPFNSFKYFIPVVWSLSFRLFVSMHEIQSRILESIYKFACCFFLIFPFFKFFVPCFPLLPIISSNFLLLWFLLPLICMLIVFAFSFTTIITFDYLEVDFQVMFGQCAVANIQVKESKLHDVPTPLILRFRKTVICICIIPLFLRVESLIQLLVRTFQTPSIFIKLFHTFVHGQRSFPSPWTRRILLFGL